MVNQILHLVTNRNEFPEDIFTSGPDIYSPNKESKEISSIKEILQLNNTDTNYYVKTILSLIDNYDYLRNKFNNDVRSYDITNFLPETSVVEFATSIKDRTGNFKFNYVNTTYPVIFEYNLLYKNANYGYLNNEIIRVYSVGNKIYPEWKDNFIYSGGFELQDSWNENTQVRISYYPKYYPADKVVERLNNNFSKESILLNAGLLEAFIFSKDNYEKVAIMATALGLVNNQYTV